MANERPLTLSEARALLYKHVHDDPSDACGSFAAALNEVLERFYSKGLWDGYLERLDVSSWITDNVMTLPYAYEGILAILVDDCPWDIFDKTHEFHPNGPGAHDAGEGGTYIVDLGFSTVTDQLIRKYKFLCDVSNADTIEALAKQRFVCLENDTDLIYPSHVGALKHALIAVCLENETDYVRSQEYWKLAYDLLDDEKETRDIGVQKPLPQNPWGISQDKPYGMY